MRSLILCFLMIGGLFGCQGPPSELDLTKIPIDTLAMTLLSQLDQQTESALSLVNCSTETHRCFRIDYDEQNLPDGTRQLSQPFRPLTPGPSLVSLESQLIAWLIEQGHAFQAIQDAGYYGILLTAYDVIILTPRYIDSYDHYHQLGYPVVIFRGNPKAIIRMLISQQ